jgi:hypothetical protein
VKALSAVDQTRLRDLVRRHRVVFEVHPDQNMVGGTVVDRGFRIELLGTHDRQAGVMLPDCPGCREIWLHLREVARAVIPESAGQTLHHDIEPFDNAWHSAPHSDRDDILLVIDVEHQLGVGPIDEPERRSMAEIVADLRSLGVQERSWHQPAESPPASGPAAG